MINDHLHVVLNQMHLNKSITPQQMHGVIIYLPKDDRAQTPADYRPIILLNEDYKLLARIILRHP